MVVLVQSGTLVSVQRCTGGSGAGTRCNFQESAADVGTVEFARWPCSSTRPHSSSSNLLCVRKDLSLVSFSAQPDQHPRLSRSPFEEIIRRRGGDKGGREAAL